MILSTSFFSSVPFLSGWLRASDGLIDTRYILIHPTLPTHKYKKEDRVNEKENYNTKTMTKTKTKTKTRYAM